MKFPILLPGNHKYTQLLIDYTHQRILHGGVRDTLVKLREYYRIVQARQCAGKAMCKKGDTLLLSVFVSQVNPCLALTVPLPEDRVTYSEPFEVIGVDFAGPIFVKVVSKTN